MRPSRRTLLLSATLLSLTSACASHHPYEPALPVPRTVLEPAPGSTESPAEDVLPPALARLPGVPSPEEWARWQHEGEVLQVSAQAQHEAPMGILVHPPAPPRGQATRSAMVRYAYKPGSIYEVQTTPQSPTYLLLPPGERLAAPPAVNPDAWAVGLVQMGQDAARQEAVVLRPLQAGQETTTALLFQSGLVIFCKLRALPTTSMVSVNWTLPPRPSPLMATTPETPSALRPPKIDVGRLYTAYRIEPQGKRAPAWLPVSTFDDGTRTYIKFREALTYTRAPGVFGKTPQGRTELVQSHMYVIPGQPERGAWLLVQGLWPELELKDSTGMVVNVLRQPQHPAPYQEVTALHE